MKLKNMKVTAALLCALPLTSFAFYHCPSAATVTEKIKNKVNSFTDSSTGLKGTWKFITVDNDGVKLPVQFKAVGIHRKNLPPRSEGTVCYYLSDAWVMLGNEDDKGPFVPASLGWGDDPTFCNKNHTSQCEFTDDRS